MNRWVFHDAIWGDLTVVVMPRVSMGQVYDSNVGVVTKAPYHKALLGGVVVNNGREPRCEAKALNQIISGESGKHWSKIVPFVYTIPTYRMPEEEKNDAYWQAVNDIAAAIGREQAESSLEMTLGWCTDSISCDACKVTIPGHYPPHVIEQARAFGWGQNRSGKPICPAHEIFLPFWTDEEIAALNDPKRMKGIR